MVKNATPFLSKTGLALLALGGTSLTGCDIHFHRIDELGSSVQGMNECAVTRLDGSISRNGVFLVKPEDMQKVQSNMVEYTGHISPTLPKGTEVHLISLSSSWNSGVGKYIEAKASIPSMGNKIYYFILDEIITNQLNKQEFARFVNDAFAPCTARSGPKQAKIGNLISSDPQPPVA